MHTHTYAHTYISIYLYVCMLPIPFIPVALLRSLSGKYHWEMYEPLIHPAMGQIVPLRFF